MGAEVAEREIATVPPRRPPIRRWVAIAAAGVAAVYLLAFGSAHVALRGGSVEMSGTVGPSPGLAVASPAERGLLANPSQYSNVLWARQPGGEVRIGFQLHNRGLVPITVLSLSLPSWPRDVIHDLAPAGAQLGPWPDGRFTAFHPVTLAPGGARWVAVTARVICDQQTIDDARMLQRQHLQDTSVLGDATSPVLVHYRALGLRGSQTVSLATPVLVAIPYRACLQQ